MFIPVDSMGNHSILATIFNLLTLPAVLPYSVIQNRAVVKPLEPFVLPLASRVAIDGQRFDGSPFANIQGNVKDYIAANITLGNPPQRFEVMVETGGRRLWVLDKDYPVEVGHSKYHSERSRSSVGPNEVGWFIVGDGTSVIEGRFFADDFTFGNFPTLNQTFMSVQFVNDDYTAVDHYPADGSLGLNWPTVETERFYLFPVLPKLLKSLDQKLYTIWLGPHEPPSRGTAAGMLTFGQIDEEHCDRSTLTWVPLQANEKDHYWEFEIESMTFGRYESHTKGLTYLDTGYSILQLPKEQFRAVLKLINPRFDATTSLYLISCSERKAQSNFQFRIGGKDWEVSTDDYILDLDLPGGKCAVALQESNIYIAYVADYNLGIPFTRPNCNVFDYGNTRVGLMRSKNRRSG